MYVAVIDDNKSSAFIIASVARENQFAVDCFHDGIDFVHVLEELGQCPYDLVFLDIQMPEMEADEVLLELHLRRCNPRIVLVTGESMDAIAHVERFADKARLNVEAVFTKPIPLAEVSDLLQRSRRCAKKRRPLTGIDDVA